MQQCNSVALFSPFTGTYLCEWGFSYFPRSFNYGPIRVLSIRLGPLQKQYRNGKLKNEIDPFLNITDLGGNW